MAYYLVGSVGGVWGTWYFARQLYNASMHDFVMTGYPTETRHYRNEHPAIFKNNVVAALVLMPILGVGALYSGIELLGSFGL